MKQFCCCDVVPGCTASFRSPHEDRILQAVAEHARHEHGIHDLPPHLLSRVRSLIHDLPSS